MERFHDLLSLYVHGDATSYPGSSLFLPRESTLILAGHVVPKIWHRKKIQKNIDEFEGNIMVFLEIPLTK